MVSHLLSHGIFTPEDLTVVRDVFASICKEPWLSPGTAHRAELARYIIRMYSRGLVVPDRLEALCRIAARKKFTLHSGLEGYRFLVVEDDYFLAMEAQQRLSSLGAEVLSIPSVSLALDVAEHEHGLDGALLDVNLAGEMVYPVAAVLKMRRIPFAFVTGYDDRILPPSYRNAPVFDKPTDWAVAASQVVRHPSITARLH
jgi:CheY-like chemotaxis protein